MTADVIKLNDFRTPRSDAPDLEQPITPEEQAQFASDLIADEWANELVHNLMMNFSERGNDIDFSDSTYGKLMEGLADVARSMTRHHLGVFDETALMLQKYPNAEVSVGIMTLDEEPSDDS